MKTFLNFLRSFVSVILCIVLFAATVATIALADVKLVLSENGIETLVKDMLSAPPASADPDSEEPPVSPVVEWAYDSLVEQYQDKLPIQQTELQELIDNSGLKDFVAEKTAGLVNDLYTGEKTTTITQEEIVEQLEENKDAIVELFPELQIETTQQIEELAEKIMSHDVMQQLLEEGAAAFLNLSEEELEALYGIQAAHYFGVRTNGLRRMVAAPLRASAPLGGESSMKGVVTALSMVRKLTSDTVLYIAIGACVLLLGLLFLLAWNKPYKAMIGGGISLTLAGGIFVTLSLLSDLLAALLSGIPLAGSLIGSLFGLTQGICIGITAFGAALLIGGIVLAVLMNRPKTAKDTTATEAV